MVENGKEIQGPEQVFDQMTQKAYKKQILERDEKEQKEVEKLRKEKELLERRRAKQSERAAAVAKLQGELGFVKFELQGSIGEVYETDLAEKPSATYHPSKLPTRKIHTADPRRREEEKKKKPEKVHTYRS